MLYLIIFIFNHSSCIYATPLSRQIEQIRENQNNSFPKSNRELENKNNSFQKQIKELENKNNSFQKQIKELEDKNNSFQKQIKELEDKPVDSGSSL